jgi:hypothetical protein
LAGAIDAIVFIAFSNITPKNGTIRMFSQIRPKINFAVSFMKEEKCYNRVAKIIE